MKPIIFLFLIFSIGLNAQEKLNVYFDFDKHNLNEEAINTINTWIASGRNYQVIKLYGFCDSIGTNTYNDTLALKRVNEVYNFLNESKIEIIKDIEIRGFGSFSLRVRSPRIGRNPKTGESVALAKKHVPHFKPGKELRDRVNESADKCKIIE